MDAFLQLGLAPLLVAALAALVSGVSKAGFGAGLAAAVTPILALAMDPVLVLGAMLPVLMAVDLAAVRAYWRRWSWGDAGRLILGAVPGIGLGILFQQSADPDALRVLIGVLALAYVAWQLLRMTGRIGAAGRGMPGVAGWLFGIAAGFTSFVSHSGGPPVLVYLFGRGLDKVAFQATTVLVFWAINLMKLPAYIALGFYSGGGWALSLWMLPFALIGVRIGLWANRSLSDRAFFVASYVLLAIAGIKLILDGLS